MLVDVLGFIMSFLYNLCKNYGVAIILFTLFSKIVLLPISIWVQKNSIKMVKMQPDINKIKINYFGDKDKIAEETAALYKKEKYNALVSLVPLIVQIVLLLGLVEVINKPLTHILDVSENVVTQYENIYLDNNKDVDSEASSLELMVVNDIKNGNANSYESIEGYKEVNKKIIDFNLMFCGMDMSWIAQYEGGIAILIPIIAGLSALIMCIGQNKMNVLQSEQSKANKWGMLIFSVLLSLYLGYFVPAGVALYWTFSNLFAVLNQWLLNIWINPKKFVNFEELEKGQKELKALMSLDKKKKRTKEQIKKEKEDYKRFFKIANKHLVFYSESNGFYKYYKSIIEYLLEHTNIIIHYITSDYNDNIFNMAKDNNHIKAYYIEEKKLITLMMKMDADVVVMTMPDLENYHIKRSYIRKDINYVYVPHGMDSLNMTMRTGSMDHYDSVLCTGKIQKEEIEKTEEVYNLPKKELVEWGYSLLDEMREDYAKMPKKENDIKSILIAPSWQKDNIVDSCLEDILDNLKGHGYKITVRPHPQHVRHMPEKMEGLKERYKDDTDIEIQTDFSSNSTVFEADLMITDWSGIAYEYAYTTCKPVLFIDTPMKIMNPEYKKIGIEPLNIWMRYEIGRVLKLDEIDKTADTAAKMLAASDTYKDSIDRFVKEYVYNLGSSASVGAKYIIQEIQKAIKRHKEQ